MIRISKLADYAVVILSIMASSEKKLMSAARLSEVSCVPEPTVSKILKMLSNGGIIKSARGINGGYTLYVKPEEIDLERILQIIDGPVSITQCANSRQDETSCDLGENCSMRGRWCGVNNVIRQALSSVSLRDLMNSEDGEMSVPYDAGFEHKQEAKKVERA
ncbi:MAG: SUF system Fe-S cluster assembly regulator [Alphaproteobacteria bacterium]|nr:SUF system Fe-S cluster assembly regulator [Alphaproteobacteria bacterium]